MTRHRITRDERSDAYLRMRRYVLNSDVDPRNYDKTYWQNHYSTLYGYYPQRQAQIIIQDLKVWRYNQRMGYRSPWTPPNRPVPAPLGTRLLAKSLRLMGLPLLALGAIGLLPFAALDYLAEKLDPKYKKVKRK